MPIYTYKCVSCGFAQDEMQKMSDALLTVCPSCGKADYAKQVTAAGFALKGTGWYATDFKDSGSKPAAKPEAAAPACGTGACPAL
ncbi:FmdB family zinc ribbon protein [Thiobacillus denitrificans]|uniref:FmdB family transcriptional regulator n=1 Tax=Thiobacillus denitrificans TaxID=36861 RepID=A0A125BDU0_THIDE|nr:FmdB family zinc ribbon protein [Thiobacillus denitrificans]KVW99708.1 FmdB family transcriptional regulator [Thiobacillus denitrificans]